MSIFLVLLPLAFVNFTRFALLLPLALPHILDPLAIVDVAVWVYEHALAVEFTKLKVAFIDCAAWPDILSFPVLLVVFELTNILLSAHTSHLSLSASDVVGPEALVPIPVRKVQLSMALLFVVLPKALILVSILKNLFAISILIDLVFIIRLADVQWRLLIDKYLTIPADVHAVVPLAYFGLGGRGRNLRKVRRLNLL